MLETKDVLGSKILLITVEQSNIIANIIFVKKYFIKEIERWSTTFIEGG